ncbi:MAG TPA: hypothetical protein VFD58_30245 [Blastocatellia bacterium]|nr:hypothetical protein [Blastocatellia bacterium]
MNIKLHIERLILDGLPLDARQSAEVRAAVEAELTRLLTAGGLKQELLAGGATPSLRVEPVWLPRENDAAQSGARIARSVYGGIGAGSGRIETAMTGSHERHGG